MFYIKDRLHVTTRPKEKITIYCKLVRNNSQFKKEKLLRLLFSHCYTLSNSNQI